MLTDPPGTLFKLFIFNYLQKLNKRADGAAAAVYQDPCQVRQPPSDDRGSNRPDAPLRSRPRRTPLPLCPGLSNAVHCCFDLSVTCEKSSRTPLTDQEGRG